MSTESGTHPSGGAEPVQPALRGDARRGSLWVILGFGSGQVLRLVSNIILAALLFEEAFALMAIVAAVMQGLAMFSDIGLRPNVVQNPRGDDPVFLNTAWTIQCIRGLVLFVLALALAWPLTWIYAANDPKAHELVWLIAIVAFTALFDGLQSTRMLTAARNLQLMRVTQIEIAVQLCNAVFMVGMAWYFRSVYALAVSGVISSMLRAALSYVLLSGIRNRFLLERESVRAIFGFGKWVFLSTLISFLALQADRLLFAGIFPLAEVGVYSIAASLALMVTVLVGTLQSSVVFPWYSRMLDDGVPLDVAFRKTYGPLLVLSTFISVLLAAGAGSFFALAYDERYAQGAVFLPILAMGVWFSSLGGMYGAGFLAKGRPDWIALVSAVKVCSLLLILVLFLSIEKSLRMATFAVLASEVITFAVSQLLGRRLGLNNWRIELLMLGVLLGCSYVGWWLASNAPLVSEQLPLVRLMVIGVVELALFLPLFWWQVFPLLRMRNR